MPKINGRNGITLQCKFYGKAHVILCRISKLLCRKLAKSDLCFPCVSYFFPSSTFLWSSAYSLVSKDKEISTNMTVSWSGSNLLKLYFSCLVCISAHVVIPTSGSIDNKTESLALSLSTHTYICWHSSSGDAHKSVCVYILERNSYQLCGSTLWNKSPHPLWVTRNENKMGLHESVFPLRSVSAWDYVWQGSVGVCLGLLLSLNHTLHCSCRINVICCFVAFWCGNFCSAE